jgi:hypothetical protein
MFVNIESLHFLKEKKNLCFQVNIFLFNLLLSISSLIPYLEIKVAVHCIATYI